MPDINDDTKQVAEQLHIVARKVASGDFGNLDAYVCLMLEAGPRRLGTATHRLGDDGVRWLIDAFQKSLQKRDEMDRVRSGGLILPPGIH